MRTPNCKCIICGKPLYRRPFELAKVRYVACYQHREQAKKIYPVTEAQKAALELGREKGTNHLDGIPKSKKQRQKMKKIMAEWCAANKDKVLQRAKKTRGENHYQWKGGVAVLNQSIRRMTENRKWMQAVKDRDGKCIVCGSTSELEADHIKPLAEIIAEHGVQNRNDARACKELWDISNGQTLCAKCHCKKDNRQYSPNGEGRRQRDHSSRETI